MALTTMSFSFSSRAENMNAMFSLSLMAFLDSSLLGITLALKAFFWLKEPKASAETDPRGPFFGLGADSGNSSI